MLRSLAIIQAGACVLEYTPEPPLVYTSLASSLFPSPFPSPSQANGEIRASNPFRLGELLPFAGFSISLAISQSLSCCAGSLARMLRITVPYITNAYQVEGRREKNEEGEKERERKVSPSRLGTLEIT
ncbi:hypothetical protein ANTQUA_LOCUS10327 [Anthophora quadrimaculata]